MFVEMTEIWGRWGGPRLQTTPLPAGYNVLPPRLAFDIVHADLLIKRAGYLGSYDAVDVTWPKGLQLTRDQPYYTFIMEESQPDFVYVGMNDQIVSTSLPKVDEGSEGEIETTA